MMRPTVFATIVVASALVLAGGAATALAIGSTSTEQEPVGIAPIVVAPRGDAPTPTSSPTSSGELEIVEPAAPHDLSDKSDDEGGSGDSSDDSSDDDSGSDSSGSGSGSGSDSSGSDSSDSDSGSGGDSSGSGSGAGSDSGSDSDSGSSD